MSAAALALPALGLAGSALLAACALAASEPRRALAHATSSQGAITLTAVALGMPAVALLQLALHACAKCLILLATGLVERASSAGLELARLGGLGAHLREAFWAFFVGTVITVLPPFAGFWIQVSIMHSISGLYAPIVALGGIGVLLTSMYLFRLLFGVFTGANPSTVLREGSTTTPALVSACLAGLVVAALALSDQAFPFGWMGAVAGPLAIVGPFAAVGALPSATQATSQLALAAAILVVVGCGWAWFTAGRRAAKPSGSAPPAHPVRHFFAHGLLFDRFFTAAIARPARWLADAVWTAVDGVLVELLCTRAIGVGVRATGWLLGALLDGRFAATATATVLSVAVVLGAVILWARP